MEISLYSDYAFRVLMYLASNGRELAQIRTISTAYHISENHLIKVVQHLVKQGFVTSVRGRSGGIRLAKEPADINIGDVFLRTEPNLKLVSCFDSSSSACPIRSVCRLHNVFDNALQAFIKELCVATLADLVQYPHELRTVLQAARLK